MQRTETALWFFLKVSGCLTLAFGHDKGSGICHVVFKVQNAPEDSYAGLFTDGFYLCDGKFYVST